MTYLLRNTTLHQIFITFPINNSNNKAKHGLDNDYLTQEMKASEVKQMQNNELIQKQEKYFRKTSVILTNALIDLEIAAVEIEKVEMQRTEKKQNVTEEINLPLEATNNVFRFMESKLKKQY